MSRDITHLVRLYLSPGQTVSTVGWHPSADVYRTRLGWLLKFDLAGVRPSDIRVTVVGHRISVTGRRRDWVVEETRPCSSYSMEITYSSFERSIDLPDDLSTAHILTEYRDGMLLVQVQTQEPQS